MPAALYGFTVLPNLPKKGYYPQPKGWPRKAANTPYNPELIAATVFPIKII